MGKRGGSERRAWRALSLGESLRTALAVRRGVCDVGALLSAAEVVSRMASGSVAGCDAVTGACWARRVDRAKPRREDAIDEVGDSKRRARGDSRERRICWLAIIQFMVL
jgi:hypothetical protein